jgi:predicted MFS family arabinose efflux permease
MPAEIWILFTATLINRAGTMALPFLVLYLTRSLGLSAGKASLAVAVYGLGALVTAPLAGRLSDRAGPLKVMKASLVISGAILFIYPLADSFAVILLITLVWAITSEAFRPASMAVIADLVAPDQRKSAFALSRLAINLGMSIGPAAGGFLAMVSFPALFIVDGATSIIAGLVLAASRWRVNHNAAHSDGEVKDDATELHHRRGAMGDRRFLFFLVAFIPVEIVFFQTQAAMPLFLVGDLGITERLFGILLTINTVLIILIEVPLNAAMAHWNDRLSLVVGALLTGIGFGALALAANAWFVAATVVVWTFGEMILFAASSAYVAEISPPDRRGEYMGLFQMSFSLSFAVGPWLGAVVLERAGATALWGATFICCLVSALMMARISSPRATDESQKSSELKRRGVEAQ